MPPMVVSSKDHGQPAFERCADGEGNEKRDHGLRGEVPIDEKT
jgi:hypothetical protein